MKDQALLDAVAAALRERGDASDAALWESVAAAEASPEQLAALEQTPEGRRALELLLPVDVAHKQRLEEAVLNTVAAPVPAAGAAPAAVIDMSAHRGRRRALFAISFAAVAAAATAAIVVTQRSSGDATLLPLYETAFTGGDATWRDHAAASSPSSSASAKPDAPAAAVVQLSTESRLEWVLRPREIAAAPVAASLFVSRDGQMQELAAKPEISRQGAVRVSGTPATLGIPEGPATLVLVVAPSGALPGPASLVASGGAVTDTEAERRWQAFTQPILVLSEHK